MKRTADRTSDGAMRTIAPWARVIRINGAGDRTPAARCRLSPRRPVLSAVPWRGHFDRQGRPDIPGRPAQSSRLPRNRNHAAALPPPPSARCRARRHRRVPSGSPRQYLPRDDDRSPRRPGDPAAAPRGRGDAQGGVRRPPLNRAGRAARPPAFRALGPGAAAQQPPAGHTAARRAQGRGGRALRPGEVPGSPRRLPRLLLRQGAAAVERREGPGVEGFRKALRPRLGDPELRGQRLAADGERLPGAHHQGDRAPRGDGSPALGLAARGSAEPLVHAAGVRVLRLGAQLPRPLVEVRRHRGPQVSRQVPSSTTTTTR